MKQLINLKNCSINELEELIVGMGEERYKAKQIFQWIHKGITDFNDMSNISIKLREKLSDISYISYGEIIKTFESKIDGTKKYLLKLNNGDIIESVLMKYKYGYSICISSQVGCRMGCRFCASTLNGLVRNLEPSEILEQVLLISKDIGQKISNIVIMGIGEPLDNYDNVLKFIKLVNSKEGMNIGYRNITLSTCGLVPKIIKLSEENIPVTLAISLHASNDEVRRKIMPIANKYSIDEIIDACKIYISKTNRRVTFEYVMIENVNDDKKYAVELSRKLKNLLCHVNLIPVNKIEGRKYKKSSMESIRDFQKILKQNGIQVTIRRQLGSDINASCGQLRNTHVNKQRCLDESRTTIT